MEGPAGGLSGKKKRISTPNLTLTSDLEASPYPHVLNPPSSHVG